MRVGTHSDPAFEQYHFAHQLWNADWASDLEMEAVDAAEVPGPGLRLQTRGAPQWFLDDQVDWSGAAETDD